MGTHPIFESDFDCLTEWVDTKFSTRRPTMVEISTDGFLRTTNPLSNGLMLSIPLKISMALRIGFPTECHGVRISGVVGERKDSSNDPIRSHAPRDEPQN